VFRDKRIAHLIVDDDLVTGVSSVGATTLDTDGQLWIGKSSSFLPGYYAALSREPH